MMRPYTIRKMFLQDTDERESVIRLLDMEQLRLDANLDCTYRVFDGDTLLATGSRVLQQTLPAQGIQLKVIPRKESGGIPISASQVRLYLQQGNMEQLETLLPPISLRFFQSPEGRALIEQLKTVPNAAHH